MDPTDAIGRDRTYRKTVRDSIQTAGAVAGSDMINAQHRELVGVVYEIQGAVRLGDRVDKLDELFGRLQQLAGEHYTSEISLLQATRKRKVREDEIRQRMFDQKISSVRDQLAQGESPDKGFLRYLMSWLSGHVDTAKA